MTSKIKNIIIFVILAVALVLVYIFFFKNNSDQANLTSSSTTDTSLPNTNTSTTGALVDTDFVNVLLSIKDIQLKDSIFSDIAFTNLRDSSITLTPLGTEGRKNPFAAIGLDAAIVPTSPDLTTTTDTTSNTTIINTSGNTAVNQTGVLTTPKKN